MGDELLFVVDAQFLEDEGYEPPQGTIRQAQSKDEDSGTAYGLNIASGRWQLSEDPEDRKDGLWIWGLFKEPLYPFLLLQFDVEKIPLPGEEQDAIKPFRLFAQINHKREDNGEVVLSSVSDLNIKEKETYKA